MGTQTRRLDVLGVGEGESRSCSGWREHRPPEGGNELDGGGWSEAGTEPGGRESPRVFSGVGDLTSSTSSVPRAEPGQVPATDKGRLQKPGEKQEVELAKAA